MSFTPALAPPLAPTPPSTRPPLLPPSLLTELEEWDAHWRAVQQEKRVAAARATVAAEAASRLLRTVAVAAPTVKRTPSDLPSPASVLAALARVSRETESASSSTPHLSAGDGREEEEEPASPRSCVAAARPVSPSPVELMDVAWWFGRVEDDDDDAWVNHDPHSTILR